MELSSHARKRAYQRGINEDDIILAIDYGTKIYKSGVLFIFLRKKDLPRNLLRCYPKKLEGITLVVDSDCKTLITLYKNKNSLRSIKRKSKYYAEMHNVC